MTPPSTPPRWSKWLKNAQDLWSTVVTQEEVNDRRERKNTYDTLAAFLEQHLQQPPASCVSAVLELVGENDPVLRNDCAPASESLLAQARQLLLKVSVRYLRDEDRRGWREIEIYFLKDKQPARSISREARAWEAMPSDVRSDMLRDGGSHVSFKLYPLS